MKSPISRGSPGFSKYEGLTEADHCAAPGAQLVEVKQCENCVTVFLRARCAHLRAYPCACQKYCSSCTGHLFTPNLELHAFQLTNHVKTNRRSQPRMPVREQ